MFCVLYNYECLNRIFTHEIIESVTIIEALNKSKSTIITCSRLGLCAKIYSPKSGPIVLETIFLYRQFSEHSSMVDDNGDIFWVCNQSL